MSERLWDKGGAIDREIHAFTVGQDPVLDRHLLPFDAMASAAHARMLAKGGLLSNSECQQLLAGLQEIYRLGKLGEMGISAELEDCHTAIEAWLCDNVGEVGKKIHTGRSRNDQVMVAFRLYLRNEIVNTGLGLCLLGRQVLLRCSELEWRIIPGYTHMRRAMPTTFQMLLLSYGEHIASLADDGLKLFSSVNWNPLGVGSGFGVPLFLDRELTTRLLAFSRVQRNPIFVQSTRGREELKWLNWVVEIASFLETFACDLLLFSMEEFGLVQLPDEFTTGSSIMPQKKNPDVLELLRGVASRFRASRMELEGVTAKLPSSYHRDYQYTKEPVIRSAEELRRIIEIGCSLVSRVRFTPEEGNALISPDLFATHYAYALCESGIPFRDAYKIAATALEEGKISVDDYQEKFLAQEKERLDGEQELLVQELTRTEQEWTCRRSALDKFEEEIFSLDCDVTQSLRSSH